MMQQPQQPCPFQHETIGCLGRNACLCLRIKDMMQNHEPLNVDQRIDFMRHLREDHKIEEYAPEK